MTNIPSIKQRPNFTLALLRTPTQPPHLASFLTPLWLNKLDLKDYLYNLYGVQVLRVRSYVIQGKVRRNPRTRILSRASAQKKMTVEMVQDQPGQGAFVWPEEPQNLEPWKKEVKDLEDRYQEERTKRQQPDERHKLEPVGAKGLKERARALLAGKVRWRPSWEEHGGATAIAMGREGQVGG